MVKPAALTARPALFPHVLLGGLIATVLLSALLYLAPAFDVPFVDIPRLIGGVFSGDPDVAFWLGYWLFFATGAFVFPVLLAIGWTMLPGRPVGFAGAALKGVLWGITLAVVMSIVLPLLGVVNQLSDRELENPGLFAIEHGLSAMIWLVVAHVLYGLALALVAAFAQGISALDTIGWSGHGYGLTEEARLRRPEDVHRQGQA